MKNIGKSLLLLLVAAIWGIAFVAQSKGMEYVGPFTYSAVRMLLGGIVLIPVIYIMDRGRSEEELQRIKTNKKTQLLGGLCCGIALFISSIFQQFGVKYTSVGKASFITALYIAIVPIISVFLKSMYQKYRQAVSYWQLPGSICYASVKQAESGLEICCCSYVQSVFRYILLSLIIFHQK